MIGQTISHYKVIDKLGEGALPLKDALEIAEALWAIEQEIRRSLTINPLLGFFAVSYEYAYPDCMDENPVVFKKTTQFETVVKNGWARNCTVIPGARLPRTTTSTSDMPRRSVSSKVRPRAPNH